MTYYWLSFVDNDRPEGDRFIGGCMVEEASEWQALTITHVLGINPGGEVAIVAIDAAHEPGMLEKFQINRLYSKAEIQAMGEYRTMEQAIEDGDLTDG
jgi:hypothetical protein